MTNVVKAGANRPAATARTRRAAQTTPLPPKSTEPTALDKLDTAPEKTTAEVQYGRMTVSELQARYMRLTKSQPKSSWRKGELMERILVHEQRANAKVEQALSPNSIEARIDAAFEVAPKAAKKAPSAPVAAVAGSGKSRPKAEAFSAAATTYGWATTLKEHGEDRVSVVAVRGGEMIYIEWMAGVFTAPCPYTIGGRTIQLKNASAAKQRMAMGEQSATEEAAQVAVRKAAPTAPKKAPRVKPLPFNDASQDDEVLTALHGRKITWTNRISGEVETDRVPPLTEVRNRRNMPKIVEGPDGRIITFTSPSGFRSVLVSAITSVR